MNEELPVGLEAEAEEEAVIRLNFPPEAFQRQEVTDSERKSENEEEKEGAKTKAKATKTNKRTVARRKKRQRR